MSKRRGKKKELDREFAERFGAELSASMLPVQCSGDGCTKRTSLMLPGDSPYGGAMFLHEGWTVIAFDHPPAMDFLCAACYQKVLESEASDEDQPHDSVVG